MSGPVPVQPGCPDAHSDGSSPPTPPALAAAPATPLALAAAPAIAPSAVPPVPLLPGSLPPLEAPTGFSIPFPPVSGDAAEDPEPPCPGIGFVMPKRSLSLSASTLRLSMVQAANAAKPNPMVHDSIRDGSEVFIFHRTPSWQAGFEASSTLTEALSIATPDDIPTRKNLSRLDPRPFRCRHLLSDQRSDAWHAGFRPARAWR